MFVEFTEVESVNELPTKIALQHIVAYQPVGKQSQDPLAKACIYTMAASFWVKETYAQVDDAIRAAIANSAREIAEAMR